MDSKIKEFFEQVEELRRYVGRLESQISNLQLAVQQRDDTIKELREKDDNINESNSVVNNPERKTIKCQACHRWVRPDRAPDVYCRAQHEHSPTKLALCLRTP